MCEKKTNKDTAKAVSVLMANGKDGVLPTQWYAFGTRQSFALIAGKYEMDFKARDFFGGNAAFASCFALVAPVGENSPPDCFLPLALLAPSLFESLV